MKLSRPQKNVWIPAMGLLWNLKDLWLEKEIEFSCVLAQGERKQIALEMRLTRDKWKRL